MNTINTIRNFLVSLFAPKYRAEGIDGSHWWGWFKPELATKPIDFIVVKATQGKWIIDSAFRANYEASQAIEVRGAYHYQTASDSWLAQADLFLRVVEGCDLHLWALDVEKYVNEFAFGPQPSRATETFVSDMRRIIDYWRTKAPAGVLVILYTNTDIYQNYIYPTIKRLYGLEGEMWLEELEIWLANYNGQGVDGEPTMPANRKRPWLFWQYSSNGRKEDYGTNGDVDLNVYNGTVDELRARFLGLVTPPPPPVVVVPPVEPEPGTDVWTGTVVADKMIVRSYPARASETDTGHRIGTYARVRGRLWVGNGYVWMKINMPDFIRIDGKWVAVREIDGDPRFIRLDPQPGAPPPVVVPTGLARVVWDDENPDYNYKSRTQMPGWESVDNPPAVYRFYPEPRKSGDYRVNLAVPYDWKTAIIAVNGGDVRDWEYLTSPGRATYNQTGWPMQAYITMSGNKLQGERVGDWFRFETLKPGDVAKVAGMTIETHPQFVHRFTCVTWDAQTKTTKHIESTGTARGQVYFFLVTKEGIAYIPFRHVKV